ncbi:MAG: ArsR/SmtB family transcription factor [Cohaesibacteraceae bacterium]
MRGKQTVETLAPSTKDDVTVSEEHLARRLKALGHPARLALVRALASQPSCCGHLVRDLSGRHVMLAQSTVSQHLGILVDAGLVKRQRCGVEQLYTLNQAALGETLRDIAGLSAYQNMDVC